MENSWLPKDLDGFHQAAQSLKLYRRAELFDEDTGRPLIEALYVDPLPSDHVLQTVLRSNTTFLIGRKGTGKSTIFQRAQHELRKSKTSISAYIDIKTLYESASSDPASLDQMPPVPNALDRDAIARLLLHKSFINSVIGEIQDELSKRLKDSFWETFKETFTGSFKELFESLNQIRDDANTDNFVSVLGLKQVAVTQSDEAAQNQESKAQVGIDLSQKPRLSALASEVSGSSAKQGQSVGFSDILIRVFNIREYIVRLQALLQGFGLRQLFVFVDDFSELPEDAMRIVVDTLLAPLNNWSNELVKFKIAAYPHRIYYGGIDNTKIDEVYLDLFRMAATDVSDMESKTIDFTTRLVDRRIRHYSGRSATDFFVQGDPSDLWRHLFYASMGNPRILGYLLFFLHESHLIHGRAIGVRAIKEAARRYYEEKIEPFFTITRFTHQSFTERSSVYSLKELLETIVARARQLRDYRESAITRSLSGRVPSSHFHAPLQYDQLLTTLELNFFVTKYYEMSDRDGRKVSIYALNYGLCQKYTIEFGRPTEKREHRLYFVERIFDYTAILNNYMHVNQELRCDHCGQDQPIENLEALKLYGMQCPGCRIGVCRLTNLSKKYEPVLRQVHDEMLLPQTELGILQALHSEKQPMYAAEIAEELDCSYQLVGKRGKFLDERRLVSRTPPDQGRRQFRITQLATSTYFGATESDELRIQDVDHNET